MNYLRKILVILAPAIFILLLIQLNAPQKVEAFDLVPHLKSATGKLETQDSINLGFENLQDFEWDSILVVGPYMDYDRVKKEHDLINLRSVKKEIDFMRYSDFGNLYLFLNKDTVVRHSYVRNEEVYVPIHTINFDNNNNKILSKAESRKLFLTRNGTFIEVKMDTLGK